LSEPISCERVLSLRKLPALKTLQAFEATARLGSMLHAAEEMNLTPSALSHQIRQLEDTLGVRLFHRVHRRILLTDAGHCYADEISDAFARIEAATRHILRAGKSDILTIHVAPCLAAQWLMPRIARFSMQHPEIDVRLNASDDLVDPANSQSDLHIRYGVAVQESGTIVESFPEETIVAVCSPKLLEGPYGIRTPADLKHHPLIHTEVNLFGWRDWQRQNRDVEIDFHRGPRFDRSFMAIGAAIDGQGVCLESNLLVERELKSGQLVMPLGASGPRIRCRNLIYNRSSATFPKIKAFRGWLFAALQEVSCNAV
jgi:LysR family transcriptional regulator, glycine cleavage system transcriptional activator